MIRTPAQLLALYTKVERSANHDARSFGVEDQSDQVLRKADEVLAARLKTEDTDGQILAYVKGAIKNRCRDLVKSPRRHDESFDDSTEAATDTSAETEDDLVDAIDAKRSCPLTADFDRGQIWDRVREHAKRSSAKGGPAMAARTYILGETSCPSDLELRSDTSAEDVWDRLREREKKRVQRAAAHEVAA